MLKIDCSLACPVHLSAPQCFTSFSGITLLGETSPVDRTPGSGPGDTSKVCIRTASTTCWRGGPGEPAGCWHRGHECGTASRATEELVAKLDHLTQAYTVLLAAAPVHLWVLVYKMKGSLDDEKRHLTNSWWSERRGFAVCQTATGRVDIQSLGAVNIQNPFKNFTMQMSNV